MKIKEVNLTCNKKYDEGPSDFYVFPIPLRPGELPIEFTNIEAAIATRARLKLDDTLYNFRLVSTVTELREHPAGGTYRIRTKNVSSSMDNVAIEDLKHHLIENLQKENFKEVKPRAAKKPATLKTVIRAATQEERERYWMGQMGLLDDKRDKNWNFTNPRDQKAYNALVVQLTKSKGYERIATSTYQHPETKDILVFGKALFTQRLKKT